MGEKGFHEEVIPEERYKTCRFCDHLIRTPYLFGHRDVEASYHCAYPDKGGDGRFLNPQPPNQKYIGSGGGDYRIPVPYFCPYLTKTE
jgi:hypothetical protein